MLRLNQHASPAAAKTYYQKMVGSALASYYVPEVENAPDTAPQFIGRVDGKLADRLNLTGGMTEAQFNELIDGHAIDPTGGERLRKRLNREGNNRVGLDLTFDPGGKSLSTYYAGTQDPLIPQLLDEARHETMVNDVEPRMMVRVRQNGASHSKLTGNALWTSFPDLVTRPTKVRDEHGKWIETFTTDPHIHDHNYIFQYSYDKDYVNRDGNKGAYLSADTSKIFSSMPYIQRAFHARLYKKLKDHGFNVVQTEHGLELNGWNDQLSKLYSRRKEEIESWARMYGIEGAELKDRGGQLTRGSKANSKLTATEQFAEWRSRLSDEQWNHFIEAATTDTQSSANRPEVTLDQAIDYGLAHTLERNNSATIEEVMHAALEVGMGLDVDQLRDHLMKRDDVVAAWFGNDLLISTQVNAAREQEVLDRAIRSQGVCLPLGQREFAFQPFDAGGGHMVELNDDQKTNVQKLLRSTSRFMTLRGAPGVGKTAALGSQLFRAVEENEGTIVTLGSTSNARDQLIKFGNESGSQALQQSVTLTRFLGDVEAQNALGPQSLVVLDETTLAGLKELTQLTRIIEERKARLLLVGDFRQMDAVQAHAKIFEQLSQLGGHAEFSEIVRQRDPGYREAATLTSSGDDRSIQAGFDKLVKLGYVQQIDDKKDRIEQAAKLYRDITSEKQNRRGKLMDWSEEQKADPAMYRSGMHVTRGTGRSAKEYEVVGRRDDAVLVTVSGDRANETRPLDLSEPSTLRVYEANYSDAILIVGTHREGEAVTRSIQALRRQSGELGIETKLHRLESIGFSNAERQNPDKYRPGEHIIEFSRKGKTQRLGSQKANRSIAYNEQFVISGRNERGQLLMTDGRGEQCIVPLDLSERFDVYRIKADKVAIGDKIRMTKGGNMLEKDGSPDGVRFSNNDVFTVQGYDSSGNLMVNNGHHLSKDWQHWRSGYYMTSMAAQGSTSSHNIFLDSKSAGKARSKESWLVSISRGKHAATILTDDMPGLRNHAILRSSQRPSATEIAAKAKAMNPAETIQEVIRIDDQKRRLSGIEDYAKQAVETTLRVIRQVQQTASRLREVLPLALRPLQEPST